ncbi:hypothetical protein N780_18765 [Pontibacillus chungwhensis BH030062]|uniref:Uncharacterized protein n=1 Tax=Pontibacillus chungwhensis BH030062 TaxID=1385513 RepID=A0A0A2UTX2_9BACI|nr:hypothetical protein N780_18765 [Pontibacillus chungwhensis BH030062]
MACFRSFVFGKGGPGNCETPAGERGRRDPGANEVSEEARQLARGKRVVSRTTLLNTNVNGNILSNFESSIILLEKEGIKKACRMIYKLFHIVNSQILATN